MSHTHRVVGKRHYGADGTVDPGEPYSPSEAELASFPHRFEPIEDADGPDTPPAAGDDTMTPRRAKSVLSDHGVEADNYTTLQRMASEYDDIAGNQSKVELQVQLARRLTDE